MSAEAKTSQDGSSPARVTPARLAGDVESLLRDVGPSLGNHDLLILPPYQRGRESLYGTEDLDAVRLARKAGIDVVFLHDSEERHYLQEYSAADVIDFAIAVGANVTSLGLTPLVNYIIARAQQLVTDRLHSGPTKDVPARLHLAYFRRGADGEIELKGLSVEGSTSSITETVRDLFHHGQGALEESHSPEGIE